MLEKFIQDYYRNTGQKWKWYAVIRLLTERRLRYLLYFRVLQENKLKFFWPFCWGGALHYFSIFRNRNTSANSNWGWF